MPTITGISHVDLSVTDVAASEQWYADLLGAVRVLDGRNDDHHFSSRYLLDPTSLLLIGLVQHDTAPDGAFDEHQVGLDHLSLNVADRDGLDEWMARLDDLGIDYDLNEGEPWDVVVFRDPDNIQLELFLMKADPADFIPVAAGGNA